MSGTIVNGQWYGSAVTDYAKWKNKDAEEKKKQAQLAYNWDVEHSKNLKETDAGVKNLEIAMGLAKFAPTLAKGVSLVQKANVAKEKKKQTATDRKLDALAFVRKDKEALAAWARYKAAEDTVLGEQKGLNDFLQDLEEKGTSAGVLKYIRDASSSELLRAKKWIGTYEVKNGLYLYREQINATAESALAYEKKFKGNAELIRQDYQDFLEDRLRTLGIEQPLIDHNYITEINKQATTLSTTASTLFKGEVLTERNVKLQEALDNAKLENHANSNALTTVVQKFRVEGRKKITAADGSVTYDYTEVDEQLASMLVMGVFKGDLSLAEWADIQTGEVKDHPAGKTGAILFSKETKERIDRAFVDRGNMLDTKRKEDGKNYLAKTLAGVYDGSLDPTAQQQAAATYLNTFGGSEHDAAYKTLLNAKPLYQSKAYYNEETKLVNLELDKTNGTIKFEALTIHNGNLSIETKNKLAEFKLARKAAGMDENNSEGWATDEVKNILGVTLDKGTSIKPGSQERVRNRIMRIRDRIAWKLYNEGQLTEANLDNAYQAEVTRLGRYVKSDQITDANYGPLTPTATGEFPANDSEVLGYVDEERDLGSTPSRTIRELGSINALYNNKRELRNYPGNNDKERLVNSGMVVTDGEYAAVFRNYKAAMQTKEGLKNFRWPPDIVRKAEAMGIQPSALVNGKTRSYQTLVEKNDPTAKNILAAFDVENIELPNPAIKVRQFLEGKDSRLLSIWEHQGPNKWTPNNMLQLMELEKKFNNLGEKREFSPEQQRAEDIKFYKENDAKGAVENFNTLYPQNNITVKDIIWNPVTKKWDLDLQDRDLIPTIRQG